MMDVKEIMKYLPHRYPFLLVDRIVSFEKGASIVGIKNVTINEDFFMGHFPGEPIMPGVLIIESIAQTAGFLAIRSSDKENAGVYLMSIEKAKFRKPVVPGDQLVIEVKVLKSRGAVWRVSGVAKVDDKVVSEAEMTAMMTEGVG
jgi:3-hydroxyacyl-[acyl-carrier-protein] dehydratase